MAFTNVPNYSQLKEDETKHTLHGHRNKQHNMFSKFKF